MENRQIPAGAQRKNQRRGEKGQPVSKRQTTFAGILILLAISAHEVGAESLVVEGRAEVVDGLTLLIWGKRIRLAGVATLASENETADAAKAYLEQLVADVRVRCETSGTDFAWETPGSCFVGSVDIAASLVRAGHARRVVQQSQGRENHRADAPLQR